MTILAGQLSIIGVAATIAKSAPPLTVDSGGFGLETASSPSPEGPASSEATWPRRSSPAGAASGRWSAGPTSPGWLKGLDVEIVQGDVRDAASLDAFVEGAEAVSTRPGRPRRGARPSTSPRTPAGPRTSWRRRSGAPRRRTSSSSRRRPPAGRAATASRCPPRLPGRPVSALRAVEAGGRERGPEGDAPRPTRSSARAAVYGPRETAIRDLFVAASRGVVPVLAGGSAEVQLVYVADVVARRPRGASAGRAERDVLRRPPRGARLPARSPRRSRASRRRRPCFVPVPAASDPARRIRDRGALSRSRQRAAGLQLREGGRDAPAGMALRRRRRTGCSGRAV